MDAKKIIKLLNDYDGIVIIKKGKFEMPLYLVEFNYNKDDVCGEIIEIKNSNSMLITYIKLSDIKEVTIDGKIIIK